MLPANSDCTVKEEVGEEGRQGEGRDHNLSSSNEELSCYLFFQDHQIINIFSSLKIQTRTVEKKSIEERVQQNNY